MRRRLSSRTGRPWPPPASTLSRTVRERQHLNATRRPRASLSVHRHHVKLDVPYPRHLQQVFERPPRRRPPTERTPNRPFLRHEADLGRRAPLEVRRPAGQRVVELKFDRLRLQLPHARALSTSPFGAKTSPALRQTPRAGLFALFRTSAPLTLPSAWTPRQSRHAAIRAASGEHSERPHQKAIPPPHGTPRVRACRLEYSNEMPGWSR